MDIELQVFETDLGWMGGIGRRQGLADRQSLARLVIGAASPAAALAALRAMPADKHGDGALDFALSEPSATASRWWAALRRRLQAYAAGKKVSFDDVEVDWGSVTPFQKRVLLACRRIPRGATMSYAELARAAGEPGAARAVGNVMARNRVPLVVPCHRVLHADGGLGGFSAPQGVSLKRRLLDMESADDPNRPSTNAGATLPPLAGKLRLCPAAGR